MQTTGKPLNTLVTCVLCYQLNPGEKIEEFLMMAKNWAEASEELHVASF